MNVNRKESSVPVQPLDLSRLKVYPLAETGQAVTDVHTNSHQGKVGVLALAPAEGLGVSDPEKRAKHLDAINRFRGV